ncbi:hypothetical protein GCK72_023356 [Caenorhabditis remanei]|uniref:DNA repair and recombination protein RAD54-like n=1 Tax=Caenorhabditis remanei TaxID=31234 RepID=A0A6A5FW90_CAERE|nr:hypothetical protein GCK72_023356 [Caenorhabditis remanei]KAF1746898.1 hypothetical protein GCK72_023356 [Caenorhabditis remanei]
MTEPDVITLDDSDDDDDELERDDKEYEPTDDEYENPEFIELSDDDMDTISASINRRSTTSSSSERDSTPESSSGSKKRREFGGLCDDNDSGKFQKRMAQLDILNLNPEYIITRMVTSEEFGDSEEPWKVDKSVWNRLHDFQKEGVIWLQKKTDHRSGGILADEMGLGKTIQAVVYLRSIAETNRVHYKCTGLDTALIVCNVSILSQWIEVLNEWFPKVRVFLLHKHSSTGRNENYESDVFEKLKRRDQEFPHGAVVLTTYSLFTRLQKPLVKQFWQVVILDEGHHIRNEDTKCSKAMRQLMTTQRFILTGTPFQNRLAEFWKLVDFVHPGRLSDSSTFHRNFTHIINAGANLKCSPQAAAKAYECLVALHRAVKPLILRRLQVDHKDILNLPEKNELVLSCELSHRQRRLYEEYGNSREVAEILERRLKPFIGFNKIGDICNHPGLYRGAIPGSSKFGEIKHSGKVAMTFKLFDEWFKDPKNRVIFFTQRRKVVSMMEYFLDQNRIRHASLTGSTTAAARPKIIKKFEEDPDIKVFLMTTRAGGLGLNLTCANKVIIFDPDWNPQADNQAKNRIYRMGQENDVSIVRLISNGTLEDRKFFKQVQKEMLAAQLLHNADVEHVIPNNTLHDLFRLKPKGLDGSEIGVYMSGEIAPDSSLRRNSENKKERKAERKIAKKKMKNKLEGFEDKQLLLSLFDDKKLVAMREHSITVQNSATMNRIEKQKMRKAVDDAVGSLLHTEGRLAHTWKQEFHKQLRCSKNPIKSDYFVEKEQLDSYWETVHSQFRANDDQRELDRLVVLAKKMLVYLNGVPEAREDAIHRMFVIEADRSNPTQLYFFKEILSTLARYNPETKLWKIRSTYRNVEVVEPKIRLSEEHRFVERKKIKLAPSQKDPHSSNGPNTSSV